MQKDFRLGNNSGQLLGSRTRMNHDGKIFAPYAPAPERKPVSIRFVFIFLAVISLILFGINNNRIEALERRIEKLESRFR
jgi:hypothetical protein